MIFVKERRRKISESNPNLPVLQIMKEVGKEWKKIGSKSKRYEQLAELDKVRYKEEYKEFQKEVEKLQFGVSDKPKNNPKNHKQESKPAKVKKAKKQNLKRKAVIEESVNVETSESKAKKNSDIEKNESINTVDTNSRKTNSKLTRSKRRQDKLHSDATAVSQDLKVYKNIDKPDKLPNNENDVEKAVVLEGSPESINIEPQGGVKTQENINHEFSFPVRNHQPKEKYEMKISSYPTQSTPKKNVILKPNQVLAKIQSPIAQNSNKAGVILANSPIKSPENSYYNLFPNKMNPPHVSKKKRNRRLSSIVGIPTNMYNQEYEVERLFEDPNMGLPNQDSCGKGKFNFFPSDLNRKA